MNHDSETDNADENAGNSTEMSGFKKGLFFLKLVEIRLRFVAVLVVTALIVGYWGTLQNYYERWTRGDRPPDNMSSNSETEYFCPMHPFVVREHSGKCPVCSMDLVLRKKGAKVVLPDGVLARVQVSPEKITQAGVDVEPVVYRLLANTIHAYGTVETDETRVARVSARFPGHVDELIVNTTGVDVKKGEALASIYSPKYLAATFEYLQALESRQKTDADKNASAESKRSAAELAEITRKPLERQGFTREQLDHIAQSGSTGDHIMFYSPVAGTVMEKNVIGGDMVDEGTVLYVVADLSTVWVQAQVIESDLAAVKVGLPVEVTSVARPGETFFGIVGLIAPSLNSENRSVKVRIIVPNKNGKLKPGMYVSATIRSPLGQFGEVGTPREPKPPDSEKPAVKASKSDKEAAPYPLSTCVVTGQKLGEMGEPIEFHHEGRLIKFCCDSCPKKFLADPKKYLAILDEAVRSQKSTPPYAEASHERWVEGFTCEMHPDVLQAEGGKCVLCDCGMTLTNWRAERVLAIPESAVIDTGMRQIVYVESTPGVYDKRAVTLGPRSGAYYPILKGLNLGDRVVGHGSFLIDAEARIK